MRKKILGLHAHGPVDYIVMFDYLDIVVTESKKFQVEEGIVQNFLQQRASQEFLSSILVGFDSYGQERKRKFDDVFDEVASILTYGIISTGSSWILRQLIYDSLSKKSELKISTAINIPLDGTEEILIEILKKLLSKLANMVILQINNVRNNTAFQNRRRINNNINVGNIIMMEVSEALTVEKESTDIEIETDENSDEEDEEEL